MTSDGTNSYSWDAENRLLQITYPGSGNNSQFSYDSAGRNVKILEYSVGSLTSTKQFVWADHDRWEARDASGTISTQYFSGGEIISGTSYFLAGDHDRSVREMTNSSGAIQAQYAYDPFGKSFKLQGSATSDFQYGSYYSHSSSGLNLTRTRAYSSNIARFINRDPIAERGGTNLFSYAENDPVDMTDPSGLDGCCGGAGGSGGGGSGGGGSGGIDAGDVFQAMLKGMAGGAAAGYGFGTAVGGVGGLVTTGPGAVVTAPSGGIMGGLLGGGLGGLSGATGNLAGQLLQSNILGNEYQNSLAQAQAAAQLAKKTFDPCEWIRCLIKDTPAGPQRNKYTSWGKAMGCINKQKRNSD